MYFGQRSMLYLPGHRAATVAELKHLPLSRWPSDNGYRGYLYEMPDATATIVVFHGNAGDAIDRRYYIDALSFANARVLLAEYPGYGARMGGRSESALVADARETLAMLSQRFPDEPLYVVGESLGAAVAAGAVDPDAPSSDNPPAPDVDGLLLLTPWSSLSDVASHHYWWLPVRWLLKDRYPSDRRLAGVLSNKIVVVAEDDEVVPARFGRALFNALPEPKSLVVVDGGRHNDWLGRVDGDWWHDVWNRLSGDDDTEAI